MAKPHFVRYAVAGADPVVLKISGSKDPFELLDHIHRKAFPDTTDEQRKASAKRAEEIMKRSRDQATRAA